MSSKSVTLEELKDAYKLMYEAEETLRFRKLIFLNFIKRASSKLVKEFYTTEGR